MSLPSPSLYQPFCTISPLEAGLIDLPDPMFITNAEPNAVTKAPSLSFLITHSSTNKRILFDLGIRKDWENYPPATVKWINEVYTTHVPQDVVDSLAKGGLAPPDIETIVLSHLHWDHIGDTTPFTKATFLVGGEGETLLRTGYPVNPDSRFAQNLIPPYRTQFLKTDTWGPLGPFPHAFDYFGDGSLYIVDSPGHLPGHINILARTSNDGGWIYLAGDSAHNVKLVTGEADISFGHEKHGPHRCAHANKELADQHLNRVRALAKFPRVKVILAHDEPWFRENRNGNAFWPGHIPSP